MRQINALVVSRCLIRPMCRRDKTWRSYFGLLTSNDGAGTRTLPCLQREACIIISRIAGRHQDRHTGCKHVVSKCLPTCLLLARLDIMQSCRLQLLLISTSVV